MAQYIHYWWDALNSRYSLLDVPHGHQSTLSDGTVEWCLELERERWWSEGYHLAPLHLKDSLASIAEPGALRKALGAQKGRRGAIYAPAEAWPAVAPSGF